MIKNSLAVLAFQPCKVVFLRLTYLNLYYIIIAKIVGPFLQDMQLIFQKNIIVQNCSEGVWFFY